MPQRGTACAAAEAACLRGSADAAPAESFSASEFCTSICATALLHNAFSTTSTAENQQHAQAEPVAQERTRDFATAPGIGIATSTASSDQAALAGSTLCRQATAAVRSRKALTDGTSNARTRSSPCMQVRRLETSTPASQATCLDRSQTHSTLLLKPAGA